ncbi:hypothetical protein SMD44_01529 [Streptomyces alboflavus]|uniref:Uncharacterized protein n=1 Tax=Streptomyces alboflavus TaxID=67267 RepID=A0A1Z1W6R4_9ACTN|nr:hypothetical protein SMD44_01529 [Streptomyces alboflavus]
MSARAVPGGGLGMATGPPGGSWMWPVVSRAGGAGAWCAAGPVWACPVAAGCGA